jgi:uncharacterized membrane protein YeiH
LEILYYIDLFGTLVFAISGVLAAIEKRFDLVGAFIMGFVTAVGGGTLRDVLLGQTPVGWLTDINYVLAISVGLLICLVAKKEVLKLRKSLFLFDSIGIGLFTILGLQKALELGLHPLLAILMGVVSAVFGGVIRDVLANEVPLIFRQEIYATACLAGAVVFYFTDMLTPLSWFPLLLSMAVVLIIRYLAVRKGWSLGLKI